MRRCPRVAACAPGSRVDRLPSAATAATVVHGFRIFEAAQLAPQVERFAADFSRGWSQGLNHPALPPPAPTAPFQPIVGRCRGAVPVPPGAC